MSCIRTMGARYLGWLVFLLSVPFFVMTALPCDLLSTIAAILAGALISLAPSVYMYQRSSSEIENLRMMNGLTLRILDEAALLPDNVKPTKDEAGNYTGGLTYSVRFPVVVRPSVDLGKKVIRAEDSGNQEPRDSSLTAKEEPDEG